ncbi:MAG: DUF3667 domain-containing protein [Candidatus Kapabacteria bacterium]|nr:DUF3667 domain-containing protein [Candidatus Kapabacteria bacterium]
MPEAPLPHRAVEDSQVCPNCSVVGSGVYCAYCGQERDIHERTLLEYVVDISYDFLSIDGKIWKGFRDVFQRPGMLTRDYLDGRRAWRPVPSRLFLVATVLAFGLAPWLYSAVGMESAYAESVGLRFLSMARDVFGDALSIPVSDRLGEALQERASLAALLSVIPVAGVFAALRRPKGAGTNGHMAHAFHVCTAALFFTTVSAVSVYSISLPMVIGTLYAVRAYRQSVRTDRRGMRHLLYASLGGCIGAFLWMTATVGLWAAFFNQGEATVQFDTPIGLVAIIPFLLVGATVTILLSFWAEFWYITASVRYVTGSSLQSAMIQGALCTVSFAVVRVGLAVATVQWF